MLLGCSVFRLHVEPGAEEDSDGSKHACEDEGERRVIPGEEEGEEMEKVGEDEAQELILRCVVRKDVSGMVKVLRTICDESCPFSATQALLTNSLVRRRDH